MPLLRRQAFVKQKPPPDLSPDEEVFHCELTNEIFRDYEGFFERVILCNSLVWSCEFTGRPQLTYQEALESEERAKKQLATFPDYLTRPILYLATLTHRSRLADVNDDVFVFVKDRFFTGEVVDVFHVSGARKVCKVLNVIPPTGNTPQKMPNGDCNGDENSKSPKSGQKSKHSHAPSRYQYLVQEKKTNIIFTTKADNLVRKKGVYTREKSKLFLKQHMEMAQTGLHVVKPIYMRRFKVPDINFKDYFPHLPNFASSIAKKKPAKKLANEALLKKQRREEKKERKRLEKEAAAAAAMSLEEPKMRLTAEEREAMKVMKQAEKLALKEKKKEELEKLRMEYMANKMVAKEEMKKRLEEEKQRMKEERMKEREKLREEKIRQAEILKEWSRVREDMECDDLKDLPNPTPLRMEIPTELFGDAVMILEFLHVFMKLLDSDQFPDGFSIDTLNKAIMQKETNGPFLDLLQFYLSNIFIMQEEEEADEEEADNDDKENQISEELAASLVGKGMASYNDLIQVASIAAQWPQAYHGTPLKQLAVDSYTITEVLRLHFLASGAKTPSNLVRYHYQQRGGYSPSDDAGLEFRREEPQILKALGHGNVFDLTPEEKLKILHALTNQLLTHVACRDFVEDNCERLRHTRIDLKRLQVEEQRREREMAAEKYKKKVEERAKEREKEAQRIAQKKKERQEQLKAEMAKNGQTGEEGKEMVIEDEEEDTEVSFKENGDDGEKEEPEEQKLSPEEQEELKAKEAEEEKVKKEEYAAKEKELSDLMDQLQHGMAIYPIGRDRLFRRYWAFNSIAGLFVEDHEDHVPDDFFQPAKQLNTSNPLEPDNVPGKLQNQAKSEEKNTSSDKENDSFDATGAKIVSPLKKEKGIASDITNISGTNVDPVEMTDASGPQSEESPMEVEGIKELPEPGKNLNVYQQIAYRNQVKWAFFSSPEDIDHLINGLNPRGIREGSLKQALREVKDKLVDSVSKCPTDLLTQAREEGEKAGQQTKFQSIRSRNRATQGRVTNDSAAELLELNLREMLLDIEERAYAGALGTLKVSDRYKWRDAIESGNYDSQCEELKWGGKIEGQDATPSISKPERMKTDEDDEDDDDAFPVVHDLAKVLLQIAQGMEPKYMQPPLGESETVKKAKAKALLEASKKDQKKDTKKTRGKKTEEKEESEDENKDDDANSESSSQVKKTLFERWEESLMSTTSLPQVFLHLATLERSILWGKSALNARCRICRRKGDAEQMLLCDGCDRGHHMYCLKPPLKNVPKGDWFCADCKPKHKPAMRSPRKGQRKTFQEDSDDEEEEDSSDEEEDSDDDEEDSDEEESDSDEEEEGSSQEDESEEEEEEEEVQKPAKIKFGKAVPKSRSGKSTPSSVKSSSRRSTGSAKKDSRPSSRAKGGNTSLNNSRSKSTAPAKGRASLDSSLNNSRSGSRSRSSLDNSTSGRNSRNSGRKRRESEDSDSESQGSQFSNQAPTKSRGNELVVKMKAAEEVVQELNKNPDAWPFRKPVTKRDAPDYFDIIKTPMDLSTVRNRINKFDYTSPQEIVEDVRLIFKNCSVYNLPTAEEFKLGGKMSRWFEKKVKEHQLVVPEKSSEPPAKRSRTRTN